MQKNKIKLPFFDKLEEVMNGQIRRSEFDQVINGRQISILLYRCSNDQIRADFRVIPPAEKKVKP
jgi:hypothetical protein